MTFFKPIVTILVLLMHMLPARSQKSFVIEAELEGVGNDTFRLTLWPLLLSEKKYSVTDSKKQTIVADKGRFRFRVDNLSGMYYFSLTGNIKGSSRMLIHCFLGAPGDSVKMEGAMDAIRFTGRGSEKLNYQFWVQRSNPGLTKKYAFYEWPTKENFLRRIEKKAERNKALLKEQLDTLQQWQNRIEPNVYNVLRLNLIGKSGTSLLQDYQAALLKDIGVLFPEQERSRHADIAGKMYEAALADPLYANELTGDPLVVKEYVKFLLLRKSIRSVPVSKSENVQRMLSTPKGLYRDAILTLYLIEYAQAIENADSITKRIFETVTDPTLKPIVESIANSHSGSVDGTLSLTDLSGRKHMFGEFKGKIVVVDFWFTGCKSCVDFYQKILRPLEERYKENLEVMFVSISIDRDQETWKQSVKKGMYTSTEVNNYYTNGNGSDDPLIRHFKISGFPTHILINKDGKIIQTSVNWDSARKLPEMLSQLLH